MCDEDHAETEDCADSDDDSAMAQALAAVSQAREWVAAQLRLMAEAQAHYQILATVPPAVKVVWLTAAELLEETKGSLH